MLYMAGDLPQALAAFEQAAKAGDNSAGNWFLRAIILDKLRQVKPAKEAYEHFLAMSQGQESESGVSGAAAGAHSAKGDGQTVRGTRTILLLLALAPCTRRWVCCAPT